MGTDTSCRTGESTLVNLSPLDDDKRNSKIDYIFFSETTAHATLSGDAVPCTSRTPRARSSRTWKRRPPGVPTAST
ncbi:hypothetical protein ACF05T_26280 [Streptomyces lateritius]|uniref:Uncharacterized protein n=1 Tax=Streptomyces lateritius TaxID=67313 RepID=A0ABW6YIA0_9ACTN